ncbi:MAG: penicillin acylase family protein [Acidobacteriaceae bacterium]
MHAILTAYADGVNAYVGSHPLPPEYALLKISHFDPWTPVDSLAAIKLIAFAESFQSDVQPTIDLLSYQAAGRALGFDGTKLFFDDLDRAAPFDPAATIPDASKAATFSSEGPRHWQPKSDFIEDRTLELAKEFDGITEGLEIFRNHLGGQPDEFSNEWAVSGSATTTGLPLMANDPHLDLGTPATWYPIQLQEPNLDVIGEGLPGVPVLVVGHNRWVAWGLTDDPLDTWDSFQEKIVQDANSPSGFSSVYHGLREPIVPIPQVFRVNTAGVLTTVPPGNGIPAATLVVPRRNNGPVVSFDPSKGTAITLQWTGFSGSREIEAALTWSEAHSLKEFQHGLSLFSAPTENVAYSDIYGNIAYFSIGEVPVREDLQAGAVNGLPPSLLRNGTGGNEWLPVIHPQPNQALPYEILPASELPHIVNPPAGFFVNANNDPIGITLNNDPLGTTRPGGGIYYLAYNFKYGFRGARITQMIKEMLSHGPISPADMSKIQADVTLLDAQVFVPFIMQAFRNAQTSSNSQLVALAEMPSVQEAVARLGEWDFTTPTGIPEGYDANDPPGALHPRSSDEIAKSVAATLYSVWRGQFVATSVDAALTPLGLPKPPDEQALAALRHLLENFTTTQGAGSSGLNFFNVKGVSSAADRRDIVILQSIANTLQLLSGPAFQNAFSGSKNLDDYRWGKLHRITFAHVLGQPFSIPSAAGGFPQPLPNLQGIPTDGGFGTVDSANHPVRAKDENSFTFNRGPSKRSVFVAEGEGMKGTSSLPGGISGELESKYYFNLLPAWLRNETYDQLFTEEELQDQTLSIESFKPVEQ